MKRKTNTLLLALLLASACKASSGYALQITVDPGCLSTASIATLDVSTSFTAAGVLSSPQPTTITASTFFAGKHQLIVLPPAGTTAISVTVSALDADNLTLATGTASGTVKGARIEAATLTLSAGCTDGGLPTDGGVVPDGSALDARPADLVATPCQPASAAADHYVDSLLGTDDAEHGGGSGSCANRTIAWALPSAAARIVLAASQTFVMADGVVLTGQQSLVCNGSMLSLASGSPSHAVVQLDGTNDSLTGCVLSGSSTIDGVVVGTAAATTFGAHTVTGCTLSSCSTGVEVNSSESVTLSSNHFVDNSVGVSIDLDPSNVVLTSNVFTDVGGTDISCAGTGGTVTGSGNNNGASGPASCTICSGCPFQ